MLKNFFPNKILSLTEKFINSIILVMLAILIIGVIYALYISPPDYIQGDAARIMYVHVPSSFIALGCYAIIGISSILNFKSLICSSKNLTHEELEVKFLSKKIISLFSSS